jgi:ABC-2 type transport system permease protein
VRPSGGPRLDRTRVVVAKEWREILGNRVLWLSFLGLLALFVALPATFAFGLLDLVSGELLSQRTILRTLETLSRHKAGFAALTQEQQLQVVLLQQFQGLFLVLPVVGAMGIATYSIVGEKVSGSLEPLLATPITTTELLVAKSLAAAVPPVAGTWLGFAVHALIVRGQGGREVAGLVLDAPAWVTVLLITPLLALLALGVGVVISARATDPRTAQQVGVLLVLPVFVLLAAQAAGFLLFNLPLALLGAALLALLDVVVLGWGRWLFSREQILVRWRG